MVNWLGELGMETFLVGCYSLLITMVFYPTIGWVGVGFMKHFLGYFLGIQSRYCEWKTGRKKFHPSDGYLSLVMTSLMEGGAFWVGANAIPLVGMGMGKVWIGWIGFIIGCVAHLLAEFTGIHQWFCLG